MGNKKSETFSLTLRTWSSTGDQQGGGNGKSVGAKKAQCPTPWAATEQDQAAGEQPLLCPPPHPWWHTGTNSRSISVGLQQPLSPVNERRFALEWLWLLASSLWRRALSFPLPQIVGFFV